MTAFRRTSVGLAVELLLQRALAQAAGIAGMLVVHLLLELLAGDGDLLRVDHDDEVARVDVRGEDAACSCRAGGRRSASRGARESFPRRPRGTSRARSRRAWRCRSSYVEKGGQAARRAGMVAVPRPRRWPGNPVAASRFRPPRRPRGGRARRPSRPAGRSRRRPCRRLPPPSASAAAAKLESRSVKPTSRPRSDGSARSTSSVVAAT